MIAAPKKEGRLRVGSGLSLIAFFDYLCSSSLKN